MQKFLKAAKEIILKAGAELKLNFNKPHSVEFKGEIDLVTEMDNRSETMIRAYLGEKFPDHQIWAEEQGRGEQQASDYLWIIDPLDGTTNYAHHFPWFSISMALQHRGETVLGLVYHPMLDELFWAIKGQGAFLGEQKIQVSGQTNLRRALLATGFPYDLKQYPEAALTYFARFALNSQGIRRAGSAALDLAYIAAGRFDGFWEEGLKPWDVAAGILMIEEAGGKVSNFKNEPYKLGGRDILASNGFLHNRMLEILNSV